MFKIGFFVVAMLLPLALKAGAQVTKDSLYSLPEVTVVATRFEISADSLPARVTRIDRGTIERYAARSVGDILERNGVGFIRSRGPTGLSGVSLRGTGPSHTALLLDGQRLTDPQLGQIDLSLLPAMFLGSIDVLHGGGASRHGSDAVAGAIDLSSMSGEARSVRLATGAGAFGEKSIGVMGTLGAPTMAVTIGAEVAEEDGDFAFVDRSSFPTRSARRVNSDRRTINLYGKLHRRASESDTQIAGWILSSSRGLPPLAGGANAGERQWDNLLRMWVSHRRQHVGGRLEVQASAQQYTIRYLNPALQVDDSGVTRSITVGASHQQRMAGWLRARVGADLSAQSARHPALSGTVRQTGAAVHVLSIVSVSRHATLFPAVRSDWLVRDGDASHSLTPSARLRVAPGFWGPVSVKMGVERSFRFPTFNDLYWQGAYASGNRDLKPEKGVSTDLGIEMRSNAVYAEVTGFYQSVQDRITWSPAHDGTWSPRNIGRAVSAGLELSATAAFEVKRIPLKLSAGYENVAARDRSDPTSETYGKQLRYTPRHTLRSALEIGRDRLSAGLSLRVVGRRLVTEDASESLPPYAVFDIQTGWAFELLEVRFDLSAVLENAGDASYRPVAGYPMPLRHLRFRLRASI